MAADAQKQVDQAIAEYIVQQGERAEAAQEGHVKLQAQYEELREREGTLLWGLLKVKASHRKKAQAENELAETHRRADERCQRAEEEAEGARTDTDALKHTVTTLQARLINLEADVAAMTTRATGAEAWS